MDFARDAAVFALLYGSGLRISEALGLKRNDLSAPGDTDTIGVNGKGGKRRVVPVLPQVVSAIVEYIAICPYDLPAEGPLFVGARGGQLSPRIVQLAMARMRGAWGCRQRQHRMPCDILSQPICSPAAAICARCRSCSAMRRWRRRRSTPQSTVTAARSISQRPSPRLMTVCTGRGMTTPCEAAPKRYIVPERSRSRLIATSLQVALAHDLIRKVCNPGVKPEGRLIRTSCESSEGDMSHGVHAVQHEVEHRIEHEQHGQKGGTGQLAESQNKKIALLIAILALFLAISETLGKSAQTAGIELNIKASNSWNFFQAKTIRQTTLRTAAEAMAIELGARPDAAVKAAMSEQIAAWKETVKRYDSDPKEQDGRKESGRKPSNSSARATPPLRATTITSWHRRGIRSGSCWPQRRSSPA